MPGVRRGLVTLALAVALLAGGPMAGTSTAASTTQADDAIGLDQVFSLTPNEPGAVSVEHRYSIPDRVVSLESGVPTNATVTNTSGFDRKNATAYAWDGQTADPTITYRLAVNRTVSRSGPKAANGSFLAVDTGEWALFTRPDTTVAFQYTGRTRPAFERTSSVDGQGAAGEWLVYLGPQDTFARDAHGQSFRLVVPGAASMTESPRQVLDSMIRASDRLRVGDRDGTVFVVAAPTDGVPWAVRGLQTGDADMWVRDTERLDDPANVWIHEYVHTRQSFATAPDARWVEEGLPAYYATLIAFEHQSMTFEGFSERLSRGTEATYENVSLASPPTWRGYADYYRGALVAGQLDRRLRVASDREQTMQTVFARLNAHERVNASQFRAEVERAGDDELALLADNYTSGQRTVAMWNRSEHRVAFGPLPARIGYSLPAADDGDGYRIGGPFRNVTTAPGSPIELVTGETLAIDAQAFNDGETLGTYDAVLRLNGTRVASDSGTVSANETVTVTLDHRFVLPGRYVASVDGESVPVHVREPARATVTNLSVEPTEVRQGSQAVARVTVRNDRNEPAEREVIVTRDFREVTRETVHLGANEVKVVEFQVPFPQSGTTRVGVNSRAAVEVAVAPVPITTETPSANGTATASTPGSPPATSDGTGAGFGAVVAVVAVACWALLARRRG